MAYAITTTTRKRKRKKCDICIAVVWGVPLIFLMMLLPSTASAVPADRKGISSNHTHDGPSILSKVVLNDNHKYIDDAASSSAVSSSPIRSDNQRILSSTAEVILSTDEASAIATTTAAPITVIILLSFLAVLIPCILGWLYVEFLHHHIISIMVGNHNKTTQRKKHNRNPNSVKYESMSSNNSNGSIFDDDNDGIDVRFETGSSKQNMPSKLLTNTESSSIAPTITDTSFNSSFDASFTTSSAVDIINESLTDRKHAGESDVEEYYDPSDQAVCSFGPSARAVATAATENKNTDDAVATADDAAAAVIATDTLSRAKTPITCNTQRCQQPLPRAGDDESINSQNDNTVISTSSDIHLVGDCTLPSFSSCSDETTPIITTTTSNKTATFETVQFNYSDFVSSPQPSFIWRKLADEEERMGKLRDKLTRYRCQNNTTSNKNSLATLPLNSLQLSRDDDIGMIKGISDATMVAVFEKNEERSCRIEYR